MDTNGFRDGNRIFPLDRLESGMNRKRHFLRLAALLPCLALAACLADGNQPAPQASAASPQDTPAAPAASAPPAAGAPSGRRAAGGGSGAGGGATTAAARAPAPAVDAEDRKDPLTQARVDCWMKVEHEKNMKDVDRRIVFVDKCVAAAMKGQ
jgi:hypothetical protein